ncbi:MAG: AAA family ATPase [Bacteroidota bacterium]
MKIKELELNNFRIYKGQNSIQFDSFDDKNIVIVSGKNGFGKTTFLMSLVWCLYGRQMKDVDEPYKLEIQKAGGYSKYIRNSLNRLAKTEGETAFSVSLTVTDIEIPEMPCKEIKITRKLDIELGFEEQLEITVDGFTNELTQGDEQAEMFIRDFILPKETAKFFLFDAEKIVSLAEITTAEQRRSLSLSYSEVLGIKKYEDLKANLEELQIRLRSESASSAEKAKLHQLEADIKTKLELIQEHEETIERLQEERESKTFEVNQIQEKLIREGNVITLSELDELRNKESTLEDRLKHLEEELKNSYELIPFAMAGGKVSEIINQLEEEQQEKTNKYKLENVNDVTNSIIDEIINTPKPRNVVIHHQVEDYYKELIQTVIRKYFYADVDFDEVGFKTLHDFSDTTTNEFHALVNNIKYSFKEKFQRISGEFNQVRNERDRVRRLIRGAEADQEDPIIAQFREEKVRLEKRLNIIGEEVGRLKEEIRNLGIEKGNIEKSKKELGLKLIQNGKRHNILFACFYPSKNRLQIWRCAA